MLQTGVDPRAVGLLGSGQASPPISTVVKAKLVFANETTHLFDVGF